MKFVQIAIFLVGLYALVTGHVKLSSTRVLRGAVARLLGLALMLTVAGGIGLALALAAVLGPQVSEYRAVFVGVDIGIIVVSLVLLLGVGPTITEKPMGIVWTLLSLGTFAMLVIAAVIVGAPLLQLLPWAQKK